MTDPARSVEAATINAYLATIWRPGEVREVRILGEGRGFPRSGYFDDPHKATDAVLPYDGKANIYYTINPVDPALLARAENRLRSAGRNGATGDRDITRRSWLYVDLDPVRPAGISATETEVLAAVTVAKRLVRGLGWPAPVASLSGNGVQLLYRVDLPNDEDTTRLVRAVLEELGRRFGTDAVKVDTSVHNAGRIAALIGTMKVKGDSTAERPHRRSATLSMPDAIERVDLERLRSLAPPGPEPVFSGRAEVERGWVARALEAAGIEYRAGKHDGDVEWLELADCPFHPGEDGYKCGPGEDADGRAMFHCFHDRGAGKGWQGFKAAVGLERKPEGPREEGPILVTGRTLADISDEPLPPLLFDIVETSGGTIMSAKGGTGKGATGVYLCGTAVEAGMTPLILDFERRPGEWARRLSGVGVPRDKVAYADRSDFPGTHKGRPLMELVQDIRSIVRYRGADLVVIDSIIAAVLAGEDKMKGDPQLPWEYMRAIEDLALPAVSFAHPPRGRADGDPFGSVMWVNAARLVWAGSRAEGDGHRVRWRAHKENERGHVPGFILAFTYGDDRRMAGIERLDDETDTRAWLQQALYEHGELGVTDLTDLLYEDNPEPPTPDELERTKARFRQQLNRMKKAGLVSRSGRATGKGAKWSNAVPFGGQEHEA